MTRPAAQAATPPGTRLILANEDVLATWGARNPDGYLITAEWGEQWPEGWYEPTFTVHYDKPLPCPPDPNIEALADALAALLVATEFPIYPGPTPGGELTAVLEQHAVDRLLSAAEQARGLLRSFDAARAEGQ